MKFLVGCMDETKNMNDCADLMYCVPAQTHSRGLFLECGESSDAQTEIKQTSKKIGHHNL